jgi:hypothetical protein
MAKTDSLTETITYVPGDGDPSHVKWGGHTFKANLPKEITGHPEGSTTEQLNHQIIESARNNPSFTVGSDKPGRRKSRADALPTDAKSYRAYVVAWLKEEREGRSVYQHAEDLIARFAQDRDLQAKCEVGFDDYQWLGTLFMPRLHELAEGDELAEAQIAALWVQHGYNQLPW